MEIIIKDSGDLNDPKARVLAIEAAAQAICDRAGQDPADGTMMLLTAAVHIAMKHSGNNPIKDVAPVLTSCLCDAIIAADDFFKLRTA